jgi:hypothetical protein
LYSSVILYSLNSFSYQPHVLLEVARHVGACRIEFLHFFEKGFEIYDVADLDPYAEWRDLPIEEAAGLIRRSRCAVAVATFQADSWSRRVEREVRESIDPAVHDGFIPCDISIYFGPISFTLLGTEHVDRSPALTLCISGDGMPTDVPRYLAQVQRLPSVAALRQCIEHHSGQPFAWSLSGS